MKITLIIIKKAFCPPPLVADRLLAAATAEHAENLHSPLKEIFIPICAYKKAAEWRL